MQKTDSGRAGLTAIGFYKLVEGLLFVVVGIGVFKLVHQDIGEVLARWIGAVHVDPNNRYFLKVVTKLCSVSDRKLEELGAGTFFYAGVFLTEGLGLLYRKTWAEYFTIIVTGSVIPIEVYLTLQYLTAARVFGTLLSIAIVWYLVADRLAAAKRKVRCALPL